MDDQTHEPSRFPVIDRIAPVLEARRGVIQAAADLAVWMFAIVFAQLLRFEFQPVGDRWWGFSYGGMFAAAALAAVLHVGSGWIGGLYHNRWRYGSFDEVLHLARAVGITAVVLALVNEFGPVKLVPSSVPVMGGVVAFCLMGGSRYVWRLLHEQSIRPTLEDATPVLVFGAGEGGEQVVTSMLRTPSSPYVPVALIDDDPAKSKLSLRGVPVVGNRHAIAEAAERYGARAIVVAIPSASPELLRQLADLALAARIDVRVLPPINELLDAPVGVSDIRPITERDLLGRHEIDTDIDAIAGYLTDRRVLVTGAGGSIGSELCRQIARFAPAELLMLDRDESALHGVQLSIDGRALLDSPNLIVADIRDRERIFSVFSKHRPQVVFHAAALKHLPLLELHPSEALKTNVHGTQHLLDAAQSIGVERFVNISTDKAADPTSVLGYSKRIAELLTATAAQANGGVFLSVRFGNVLGSRGSVLTTFRAQIDAGGPVTVTHPDVTRYFMTIEEAVQLVIQAGAVGRDGEALVLDMGDPVRIDDVARRLVNEAHRRIEVVYTGLRAGEKLHEVLWGREENDHRPIHPLISHVPVPTRTIEEIRAATAGLDDEALRPMLRQLAGGAGDPDTSPARLTGG